MNPLSNEKNLERIIKNYVAGKATIQEIEFLERYYDYLNKEDDVLAQTSFLEFSQLEEKNFKAIQAKIKQAGRKTTVIPLYRYAAAAMLLISLGVGAVYFSVKRAKPVNMQTVAKKSLDIQPGKDKAILTLADGSQVILDETTADKVFEKRGIIITKTKDGQLIYTVNAVTVDTKTVAFNTIKTAKGNQYQIRLPDGTKVWLNAASSLKYPEIFTGKQREVELTGEGYFEVANDKNHPFIVKTVSSVNGINQEIEVLGTHFNINSYMDEKVIKTTLLEGSVRVSNSKSAKFLMPGQQSQLNEGAITIIRADTDDETAWKNDLFRFNSSSLTSILNQLERWYDIKIAYGNVPNKRFIGMISRTATLSQVLKMLELTGNIGFEIKENRELRVFQK